MVSAASLQTILHFILALRPEINIIKVSDQCDKVCSYIILQMKNFTSTFKKEKANIFVKFYPTEFIFLRQQIPYVHESK